MNERVARLEERLDSVLPTLATKADLEKLGGEVHKGSSEIIKWLVGTAFAAMAAFVVIMTFVLNNAVPKALPAPVAQAAPIIIQVPTPVEWAKYEPAQAEKREPQAPAPPKP